MTDSDLDSLSLDDLKALQKKVNKAVDGYQSRRKMEALAALEAAAKGYGFTLAELTGSPVKPRAKTPSAAKYRHPENPEQVWSGRGRQPGWFKEAVAAGQAPADFLI